MDKHVVALVYRDPNLIQDDMLDGSGMEKPREFKLPSHARDGTLTFTVPESGTDEAHLAFESPPKQPAPHAYRRPF